MKKFQSQVSTLWVALGCVDVWFQGDEFNESNFLKELKNIHFTCPTLKHCLRNGKKIVELAKKDGTKSGLNCFASQVKEKIVININDGLLHEMPFIYSDHIEALQQVFEDQNPKNTFICIKMS